MIEAHRRRRPAEVGRRGRPQADPDHRAAQRGAKGVQRRFQAEVAVRVESTHDGHDGADELRRRARRPAAACRRPRLARLT